MEPHIGHALLGQNPGAFPCGRYGSYLSTCQTKAEVMATVSTNTTPVQFLHNMNVYLGTSNVSRWKGHMVAII